MPQRYWLETYGCQMNSAESNAIESQLTTSGYVPALTPEDADIVILNTCSVRQTAENRIWGRLGFFQHLKSQHQMRVVVTGCMAERLSGELKERSPAVDIVIGTHGKDAIASIIQGIESVDSKEYTFAKQHHRNSEASSLLPIMNGCDNFCAYCIVPYVRGPEVSRSVDSILQEIDLLMDDGIKEITLLGQNVNSYRQFHEGRIIHFPELLDLIVTRSVGIPWIRFLSPHPKDVTDELISVIAQHRSICRHIHLPVQSGSNGVLQRMNRKYTIEHYRDIIGTLRSKIDDMTFTTDILVGFPGESEEDFLDTLRLVEDIRYIDAYMYYYNPREGTVATSFSGQISDVTKLDRLRRLIDAQRSISLKVRNERLMKGKLVTVLSEGVSKRDEASMLGKTEHDEKVVFPITGTARVGELYQVRLLDLSGSTFIGEVICPGKQ